ncbi:hypothetical protein DV738_g2279, partial [Chaetothyriales sp. CBS 135597]
MDTTQSSEFRRMKKNGWMDVSATTTTAGAGSVNTVGGGGGGEEEADRILEEMVAQDRQRRKEVEMEDAPAVVEGVRIEARQREREAEERKRRQREEAMGEVQRREKQERKQDLADAKFLALARTADDEDMNERLKSQVYQGHAAPNRYGIKPGWRWDGVDRGNGFEKQWFQARAQKARNTDLTYQWQEDE